MTFNLTSSDRALIAAALEVVNPGEEGQEKRARLLAHIFDIAGSAQVTTWTDNTCTCADCATGKIQSVAGPGCSLPAHEYTERVNETHDEGPDTPTDRFACWNCGAEQRPRRSVIDELGATDLGNGRFAFKEDGGWRIADYEALGLWSRDGYGDWVGSNTIKVDAYWWTPTQQFAYIPLSNESLRLPSIAEALFGGVRRITVNLETGEEVSA